jgi:hypothetical protein
MSESEREILEWLRLDASLHAAAILSDVKLCDALRWIEDGEMNPRGKHREYSRAASRLEYRHSITSTLTGCLGMGRQRNGNGSGNGNGPDAFPRNKLDPHIEHLIKMARFSRSAWKARSSATEVLG